MKIVSNYSSENTGEIKRPNISELVKSVKKHKGKRYKNSLTLADIRD